MSINNLTFDSTLATEHGTRADVRDFPDLPIITSFKQPMIQDRSSFQPIPLDSQHPTERNFYLVGESPATSFGGDLVSWVREYATIPASRSIPQSHPWKIPGLGAEAPPGSLVNITGSAINGLLQTLTVDADPDAVAGGTVSIQYVTASETAQQNQVTQRGIDSATASQVVITPPITDPNFIGWLQLQTIEPGRDPEVMPVASDLEIDYFLPNVNTGSRSGIPIVLEYAIISDSTGRKTASFTATSVPSLSTYRAKVAAGARICCARSTLTPWKGNIVARQTRYTQSM
tara:strand:- start:111 stop:974 length:864 start_codon:yes stop_codon:yes gene_type:complete